MPSGSDKSAGNPRQVLLGAVAALLIVLSGCTTEAARQTATSEAQPTPDTTITPSGDLLMIDDEIVRQIFIPDPEQAIKYALTAERLYVWRDREWQPTSTRNTGRSFLVDHNTPERLFRGDHPTCGQEEEHEPIALEVSEDSGETWSRLPTGDNIRPLAIDPVFPDVLYGTDCSLTISPDLGETWRYIQALFGHEIIDIDVVGERLLVLGISTQGKSQVRELRLPNPEEAIEVSDIIVQVDGIASMDANDTTLVIGAPDGIRISHDGGANWATSRIGLESVTIQPDDPMTPNPSVQRINPSFGILTVVLDPTHDERIFAGTVRGLYISQDNGGTWDHYNVIDERAKVLDIQVALGGADLYVTTDAGVVAVPNP